MKGWKTMNKNEMIAKLNRKDLQGVGVVVTTSDDRKQYFFYEDMTDSKGIERAARHAQIKIDCGAWKKAEYIYKSLVNVCFIDYDSQPGTFTFNGFYRRYNKNFNIPYVDNLGTIISDFGGGLKVRYEHKPKVDGIQEIIWLAA
jgi:hypothetical protein